MANYQIQKDEILSITSGILSEALTATAKPAYDTGVEEGVAATKKGTAVASQVLSGQTFTNSSVVEGTGTMPNKGAVSSTLPLGGSYVNTEGYYSSINIDAASATGNAAASQVLSTKTFTNSSNTALTGTMSDNGSVTSTLGYGQSYTGTAGYYSGVNITASNVAGTAQASEVLTGKSFINSTGTLTNGSMANQGSVSSNLPLGGSYSGNAGYYGGISINAASATGNAVASEVLADKTFTNSSNTSLTGSMPNKGSVSSTLGYGQSYTGTAGYYSSINVTASNVAGTAQASEVLNSKTFINSSGTLKTGSMTNRGSVSSTLPLGGSYSGDAGYYSGINITAASATGNVMSSDVLSGKTFTNSIGSGTGTMSNKGAVSSTIQPGTSYSNTAGYYSSINITAAATTNSNTGTTVLSDNINSTAYQSFSSGDTDYDMGLTNAIRYIDGSGISNGVRVAHTVTYNDGGQKISSNYGNNVAWTKVLSVPGASSLKVFYHCQTESTSYDWGCIWQGNYPSYTADNYSSSVTGKLGGTTAINSSITITGSVCTVAFKSDTSSDAFDGLYVLAMDASLADTLPIGGGGATGGAKTDNMATISSGVISYDPMNYSPYTVQITPGVLEYYNKETMMLTS